MSRDTVQRQRGFTLVEMAVVMVVIGLILGAVMIGRDVQWNAEYQQVANRFAFEWKKLYDQHYQRAGVVIGDSQVAPTRMVNGAEATIGGQPAHQGNSGGAAGLPENYANTGLRLCNGTGYTRNDVGAGDPELGTQNLLALLQRIGLNAPAGRGEGMGDRYLYTDSNGNAAELQVCFQWNPPGTRSGAGNVMVLRGLTPDLARFLDQLVDGKADAIEGRFRMQDATLNSNNSDPRQRPGAEWSANNTYAQGESNATAEGTGNHQNENRVILLTAHWAMDL